MTNKIHRPPGFTILAIETSCDETAAAVVRDGRTIISNVVASQIDEHRRYGGVVPEVASRQHILSLSTVVQEALAPLPDGWNDIHAVAATYGPGLSGALLTGLNAAKGIAWTRGLPFVGVNHLDAHIYANWLMSEGEGQKTKDDNTAPAPTFPLVALIVSGGHTILGLLRDHGRFELLGQTRDDAAGEAFDKVARILGLGYPGGPAVQRAAQDGADGEALPRAWLRDTYDFSFSGIKTAVLHKVQERQARESNLGIPELRGARGTRPRLGSDNRPQPGDTSALVTSLQVAPSTQQLADDGTPDQFTTQLAYAFQESVIDVLVSKTVDAARIFGATEILLAGGVAANARLRLEMERRASIPVRFPPIALCTDNAAMVAAAAYYRFDTGLQQGWDLDVAPNLRIQ